MKSFKKLRSFRPLVALQGREDSFFPALDGLRGLAALLIFTRHAWGFAGRPRYLVAKGFSLDWLLVESRALDLFLVLSAFLLGGQFFRSALQGKASFDKRVFFRRRFYRIFPAYWLVLLLVPTVCVPWLVSGAVVYSGKGFFAFIGYIPALSTLLPWSFGKLFLISPVWTLTLEVTFYLLLPFIWPLFRGRRWRVSVGVSALLTFGWLFFVRTSLGHDLAGSVGQMANTRLDGPDLGRIILVNQFPSFVFSFALGLTLSSIWANTQIPGRKKNILARHPDFFLFFGLFIVVVSMGVLGNLTINKGFEDVFLLARDTSVQGMIVYYFEHTLLAVGSFLFIAGVVFSRRPLRILNWHWLRALGILGYGMFLLHFPVLFSQDQFAWLTRMTPAFRFPVAWVMGLVTTIGLAIVLWFGVERPFIALGKRSKEIEKSSLVKQESD